MVEDTLRGKIAAFSSVLQNNEFNNSHNKEIVCYDCMYEEIESVLSKDDKESIKNNFAKLFKSLKVKT